MSLVESYILYAAKATVAIDANPVVTTFIATKPATMTTYFSTLTNIFFQVFFFKNIFLKLPT